MYRKTKNITKKTKKYYKKLKNSKKILNSTKKEKKEKIAKTIFSFFITLIVYT